MRDGWMHLGGRRLFQRTNKQLVVIDRIKDLGRDRAAATGSRRNTSRTS